METINNMASAAVKAVWGEGENTDNREPISGAKGDVASGEPYDAGNLEASKQKKVEDSLSEGALQSMPAARPSENATESSAYAKTENQPPSQDPETGLLSQDELKGAGPRPLEVVAKENGGDASVKSNTRSENTLGETPSTENSLDTTSQSSSHSEPVRASGLAADGGDFDATKPGAGAAADRLKAEKGVTSESAGQERLTNSKDKPSLGERIKAKFHKH